MHISIMGEGLINKVRPQQGMTDIKEAGFEQVVLDGRLKQYVIPVPDEDEAADYDFYLNFARGFTDDSAQILLTNTCKNIGGHYVRGYCSDPYEALDWIERLNRECGDAERFAFCMDVGACNLCGQNMQETAEILGDYIKAVIIRDNNGHENVSLLPFTSVGKYGQVQTDWISLIRGLRSISFDGELILDMQDTVRAFSVLLRPQLLAMGKSVMDYLAWQINIENVLKQYKSVVLFGAGNMTRNYMKCYGETYPPLFTCDNNADKWGTKFSGLEVKDPRALLELPDDCCVMICNIYYREIEKQLREMGVNHICYFNDEYLPEYPFDRLEMS